MKREFSLTQPQRLVSLFIDLFIVALACCYLFGVAYPPLGDKGFWAYSSLLAVLVGSKLVTPFYVKPADAVSYAVPALISLMLINEWANWSLNQRWGFSLSAGFSLFILVLGIGNIVVNSWAGDIARDLSNRTRIALDLLAQPRFIYTPLVLFSLFSFHRESWIEAVTICLVTGATVWWSVGDFLIGTAYRLVTLRALAASGAAAQVVAFQDPGIILLRQEQDVDINRNDVLFVNDRHGPKKLAAALNYVGRLEGVLIRAVELKILSETSLLIIGSVPVDERAYRLDARVLEEVCRVEGVAQGAQSNVIGLVAPDTAIERLYFEVVDNSELEEGRLVSTRVGNADVMYQIVAGLTREEIVQQKNTYGYLRAQAQQIGIWHEDLKKFTPCHWLPTMNTPVYLQKKTAYQMLPNAVGRFPGSNFHATLKSVSDLVTHNTAILGISRDRQVHACDRADRARDLGGHQGHLP
jgi:uncharacterized protein